MWNFALGPGALIGAGIAAIAVGSSRAIDLGLRPAGALDSLWPAL